MNTIDQLSGNISTCYQTLQAKQSNLVLEVLPDNGPIYQWQHYPKGDVKDPANFSQYYYHAHPSKDEDRVPEHGHFHMFYRHDLFKDEDPKLVVSDKYLQSNGKLDNLTHLVAIAMNELGYPTAFFTVNYWVVLGVWYSADILIKYLDNFVVNIDNSPYTITSRWISNMIQLFKPQLAELLILRDKVVEDFQTQYPDSDVYFDKTLEITSVLKLQ